jgi:transposase
LHVIGKETVRSEVEIIPAKVRVIKHVRIAYGCRHCETQGETAPVVKSEVPKAIIPNSIASPAAVAYVMYEKYSMMAPLARQEKDLEYQGLRLHRQTMANWVITCAEKYLMPVFNAMHRELISHSVLHCDETFVQVLKEEGRKPTTDSYMWMYRTAARDGPSIALFEYQPTRNGDHPRLFLTGFKGYIICDGYAGYNKIPDVKLQGCFSHCRKYYTDALELIPKENRAGSEAAKGLAFCNKIFDIERKLENCSDEKRFTERQKDSKAVLEAFLSWLWSIKESVLPKSRLGQAVTYSLNQWNNLTRFLEDGRLEVHNNFGERTIRPFTLARKNFMFCDTVKGAKSSAVVFSIIQTAKENGLNPHAYLSFLLKKMIDVINDRNPDAVFDLLPWSPSIPNNCKFKNN